MSVRELAQRAAKLIMQNSKGGPAFERRIDLFEDVTVWDEKLQRKHPITIRLRVTVRSRILESSQTSDLAKPSLPR